MLPQMAAELTGDFRAHLLFGKAPKGRHDHLAGSDVAALHVQNHFHVFAARGTQDHAGDAKVGRLQAGGVAGNARHISYVQQ